MLFRRFESLLEPYPEAPPQPAPTQFLRFLWECTRGLRGLLLSVTLVSAAIGSFEALLFAMVAHIVDVLASVPPAELWLATAAPSRCWPACSSPASPWPGSTAC